MVTAPCTSRGNKERVHGQHYRHRSTMRRRRSHEWSDYIHAPVRPIWTLTIRGVLDRGLWSAVNSIFLVRRQAAGIHSSPLTPKSNEFIFVPSQCIINVSLVKIDHIFQYIVLIMFWDERTDGRTDTRTNVMKTLPLRPQYSVRWAEAQ